jgi:hypothetical protein
MGLDGLPGLASWPGTLTWHPDLAPWPGTLAWRPGLREVWFCYGPWTLIRRLPGAADISPSDPSAFARQLGEALARIHATGQGRFAGWPSVFGRPGGSPAHVLRRKHTAWTRHLMRRR